MFINSSIHVKRLDINFQAILFTAYMMDISFDVWDSKCRTPHIKTVVT